MLSIILLYFIGKPFYELAEEHYRSKWGWAILGVVVYYIGSAVLAIGIAIVSPETLVDMSSIVISLTGIPIGLLFAWGFYHLLKNQWNKTTDYNEGDILDQNLNNSNEL